MSVLEYVAPDCFPRLVTVGKEGKVWAVMDPQLLMEIGEDEGMESPVKEVHLPKNTGMK